MIQKIIVLIFLISFLLTPKTIFADETSDLSNKINEYTLKLYQLSNAKNTLSNQIKIIDSQVSLTLLKITQTENTIKTLEQEINGLSQEINKLNIHLNDLSIIYINQIIQNYKLQKRVPEFAYIFSSNLNDFLEQHKYITILQKDSQTNLINMETARTNYDLQKTSKEKKQAELEELKNTLASQKTSLNQQKSSKNTLLEITKNDEKKYSQLKAEAERELSALLNAKFVEKKSVNKGDILGIMGNTGYSFGAHLHFGLYSLSESNISSWTYANDIDPTGYMNQHRWPMDNYSITQGRGATQYSYLYSDRFHHGVDMVSDNKLIKAVNDGVAYYYRNAGSSLGNHVKLFHPDGKMTLYLHMQ